MKRGFIESLFAFLLLLGSACSDITGQKTTIQIEDNYRHYYPILQGEHLEMFFTVNNLGSKMFILSDLQTSCGCLVVDKSAIEMIPPGKKGILSVRFDSGKNVGFVEHFITLYGNLSDGDMKEIVFDINVVPNSLYSKDYEEIYNERKKVEGFIEEIVDGKHKGYYVDKPSKS